MPNASLTTKPRLPKYSSVDDAMGAAPVKRKCARSRPMAAWTFFRMTMASARSAAVSAPPRRPAYAPAAASARPSRYFASATFFAHVLSFFLTPVVDAPTAWSASANFSQTRGTPKKTVGRTCCSVAFSVPFSASGRAKKSVAALTTGPQPTDRPTVTRPA